jgi:hypothetical protein
MPMPSASQALQEIAKIVVPSEVEGSSVDDSPPNR